jgi:hypothetical protein
MSKQYLFRVEILSKKDKHPLESTAYYSGEKQFDILNSKGYDSTTQDKVIWSKILIPEKISQNELFSQLPDYLKFRSQKTDIISNARNILWQGVNNRETRPDSQFSRLFELAIPHFLTLEESINLLNDFGKVLVNEGMIVDSSLHSHNKNTTTLSIIDKMKFINSTKDSHNDFSEKPQDYTGFLMCTLRHYENGRFTNKNRDWNNPFKLKEWRTIWVNMLSDAINSSAKSTTEERNNWQKKLSIYPDYNQKKSVHMSL